MNIISQFNDFLTKNFNNFLNKYFNNCNYWYKSSDFNNYLSFMNDLDSFSNSFMKDAIVAYFEYIDNVFFNSPYRKRFCESKGFYERKNFVTIFGNINFKRRYYYDKFTKEHFYFVDLFLGLPKRKHFDPIVCSEIVNKAAEFSYSKSGKLVAEKIGSKIDNNFYISRATARNIVLNFNPIINEEYEMKRVEKLYVMLDEKFVASQFNNSNDHMIKAAVIFEGSKLEYKHKKKPNSIDRYKLLGTHTCASINNELLIDTLNYIYNTYDISYLKDIYFMGDCATWIKNFPKSSWFKFNKDTNVTFSMDNFHFSQALENLTTNKYPEVYNALLELVSNNDKDGFILLANQFKDLFPERYDTIQEKINYILNNWKERQVYLNKPYLKCSMESHISHIFADLFTSRPKSYSKKGLEKLLQIRLLKVNGYNLKEIYFKSLNNLTEIKENIIKDHVKLSNLNYHTNESVHDYEYKIDSSIYYPYENNIVKYI